MRRVLILLLLAGCTAPEAPFQDSEVPEHRVTEAPGAEAPEEDSANASTATWFTYQEGPLAVIVQIQSEQEERCDIDAASGMAGSRGGLLKGYLLGDLRNPAHRGILHGSGNHVSAGGVVVADGDTGGSQGVHINGWPGMLVGQNFDVAIFVDQARPMGERAPEWADPNSTLALTVRCPSPVTITPKAVSSEVVMLGSHFFSSVATVHTTEGEAVVRSSHEVQIKSPHGLLWTMSSGFGPTRIDIETPDEVDSKTTPPERPSGTWFSGPGGYKMDVTTATSGKHSGQYVVWAGTAEPLIDP